MQLANHGSEKFHTTGTTGRTRNGSSNFFYDGEQLGSVRTMTDNSGIVQASFSFDPYGRPSRLAGSADSDFGFAGMYVHARSGLNLTMFRAYSPTLGRWISRDPIAENGGVNLFAYVENRPVSNVDPLGLQGLPPSGYIIQYPGGHWGGQGFVNDQYQSKLDDFLNDPHDPDFHWPSDPRDECYYRHDVCLHNAARIKDPKCRHARRRQCDKELAQCLARVRSRYRRGKGPRYGDTYGLGKGEESIFNNPGSPNDNADVYRGDTHYLKPHHFYAK